MKHKRVSIAVTISACLLFIAAIHPARAQDAWTDAGKLSTGAVCCFGAYSDTLIFAGCDNRGLFVSIDRGHSWTSVGAFPPVSVPALCIAGDSSLFAGTSTGIYRSDNRGESWSGPLHGTQGDVVLSIVESSPGAFIAGCRNKGCLTSTDRGLTWSETYAGHTINSLVRGADGTIYCIADDSAIRCSRDGGNSWFEYSHRFPDNILPMTLSIEGRSLLAGTTGGIYERSDPSGGWETLFQGKPASVVVRSADGNLYFASLQNGLLSWERNRDGYYVSRQRSAAYTTALHVLGDTTLIIGTDDGRIAVASHLSPPVPKGPDDWNGSIRIPITLGFKSGAAIGLSVEIRLAKFASFQVIQSISAEPEGQRLPFQIRGIVYPLAGSGLYAGAGYFHFSGYTKQGMPGDFEYYSCGGPELLVGYRLPFFSDVEVGWRRSGQPWGIFYRQFKGWWDMGPGETEHLNEFFFVINLHIVKF